MWIVFFCMILILGFVFSKIKVNIEKIKIDIDNFNFKIKLGFLWFGIIKIFGIEFNEIGIKFLNKQIKYKKIINESQIRKMKKDLLKINLKNLDKLNPKVEIAKFSLRLGTEDIFITTFLVAIVSTIIAEIFRRKINKINLKKTYYKVLPEFNRNEIYYEGKTLLSIKTRSLGSFIFKNGLKL